jgi:hypothetical protein
MNQLINVDLLLNNNLDEIEESESQSRIDTKQSNDIQF